MRSGGKDSLKPYRSHVEVAIEYVAEALDQEECLNNWSRNDILENIAK